jgi:hypothetical protein
MTMYQPSDATEHVEKEPAIELIPVKSIGLDFKNLERGASVSKYLLFSLV